VKDRLLERFQARAATIAVIGLGYVGLPLADAFCRAGFTVIGFDIDADKVARLNRGVSYLKTIPDATIAGMRATGRFHATDGFAELAEADAVLLCVPTPLTRHREPDMTYVVSTTETVARHLRAGQLVVLESTTYPGTTAELVQPRLEAGGLVCGRDFFLGYSPEREDPGNIDFQTSTIPKVVGGADPASFELAEMLYRQIVGEVVTVSSLATAEAVKLTENIFRAVNIALVNELKVVFERMGIDIWEVIAAASTKPFGYMAFYPGPGLGGHCIPIDPFYLTWKAREFEIATRFIELAGEINRAMPDYVVERLAAALDMRFATPLNGARVLVVGLAYKKNVDDTRESPAFRIISLLERRGARVDYYDPFVPEILPTREYAALAGRRCIDWTADALAGYDAALICTDHDAVDYAQLVAHCRLVVDTRDATRAHRAGRDNVVAA
jgi:UDP-N-acetyl-D-glucosamine dehydrogenase